MRVSTTCASRTLRSITTCSRRPRNHNRSVNTEIAGWWRVNSRADTTKIAAPHSHSKATHNSSSQRHGDYDISQLSSSPTPSSTPSWRCSNGAWRK